MTVQFIVEQAGCISCAERVRDALRATGTIEQLDIDEGADAASVRLVSPGHVSQDDVDHALRRASEHAGHAYRVQAGSWTPLLT